MNPASTISFVIDRHVEDAAFLWLLRDAAIKEPHYSLKDLAELDNRLAAHLDGLSIAGESGWQVATEALSIDEPGEVFVAAWLAIEKLDGKKLESVLTLASQSPENYRALVSALAWHSDEHTQGFREAFLRANDAEYFALGINLCALHRIDPEEYLAKALTQTDEQQVARALRAVGELQRKDLLRALTSFRESKNQIHSFWANWSACLLGDMSACEPLKFHVLNQSLFARRALQLIARCMPGDKLRSLLQALAKNESTLRLAMLGAGCSGDPHWIPGLLKYMDRDELARAAGEAFSMITGVDLAYVDLDRDRPEDFTSGPTDNPEDDHVALDEDSSLPWPNQALLQSWWQSQSHGFQPGIRYLCGQPIREDACLEVLAKGYQRQRNAAALELALMGLPYFETRAPGWRQLELLKTWPPRAG